MTITVKKLIRFIDCTNCEQWEQMDPDHKRNSAQNFNYIENLQDEAFYKCCTEVLSNTAEADKELDVETYSALALSTELLSEEDKTKLTTASLTSNTIHERDTGFLIKLPDEQSMIRTLCDENNLSENVKIIFSRAIQHKFRLIEFDTDVEYDYEIKQAFCY